MKFNQTNRNKLKRINIFRGKSIIESFDFNLFGHKEGSNDIINFWED